MIQLGQTITDKVTGFSGIVVGRVEYLTGCNQVMVSPPVKEDGSFRESTWLDEQRCVVQDVPIVALENGSTPGAGPTPTRETPPLR